MSAATITTAPAHAVPLWVLKLTMAVTGVIWAVFVLIHLLGNLKAYLGAEAFDHYAHWLREVGYPLIPHSGVLWALRVVLLACLVAHVAAALTLLARSRAARGPVRAARTGLRMWNATFMLPTGLIILAFLGLHLLDLTLGVRPVAPEAFTAAAGGGSPYANLVASFSRPWAALAYGIAMLAAAVHVLHGTILATSDFGAMGLRLRHVMAWIGGIAAAAILLGNASIPAAVQLGVLG